MIGWRDEASTRLFRQPDSPRSESIVLDAVRVASAEIDAAVLTLGSIWDFAAPSLILAEAGGVFRDAWGGDRFDTQTARVHERRAARSGARPARRAPSAATRRGAIG